MQLTREHGLGHTVSEGSDCAQDLNAQAQTGRSSLSELASQIVQFALCHLC